MSEEPAQGVVGECCVTGYLETGTPKGTEITVAGFPAYLARAGSEPTKHAILFFTDVFGYRFNNARLVADMYAENGFDVYVPDLHDGVSLSPTLVDAMQEKPTTFAGSVNKAFRIAGSVPGAVLFMAKHGKATVIPKIDAIIKELRSEKFGVEKIASVGFCWGGPYSAMVAAGKVEAAMIAHPAPMSPDVFKAISVPTFWNLAEGDYTFPKSSEEAARKALTERNMQFEMTLYKDVQHGFLIRGDPNSKVSADSKKDAHAKTLAFFKSVL
ncbi:dienelactone hydrolase [Cladochytrium replicatum]|nr:dienelactone hydrolase [Cladochytrium replicatum]